MHGTVVLGRRRGLGGIEPGAVRESIANSRWPVGSEGMVLLAFGVTVLLWIVPGGVALVAFELHPVHQQAARHLGPGDALPRADLQRPAGQRRAAWRAWRRSTPAAPARRRR